MKPAWDKLMKEYEGSSSGLVADVDCTADGKDLCETVGVQGFPTIKWGDPSDLQDYEGGRGFDELEKFADENLKPVCSPVNIELCDEEKKKQINDLTSMAPEKLDEFIETKEKENKEIAETFEKEVEKLQKTYEELEKAKTEKIE